MQLLQTKETHDIILISNYAIPRKCWLLIIDSKNELKVCAGGLSQLSHGCVKPMHMAMKQQLSMEANVMQYLRAIIGINIYCFFMV